MLFSQKQGLSTVELRIFFKSQWQCTQWTVYLSYNFNNCSERLCEGIGQTLRKDDSCDSTLAIYLNYLSTFVILIHTLLCNKCIMKFQDKRALFVENSGIQYKTFLIHVFSNKVDVPKSFVNSTYQAISHYESLSITWHSFLKCFWYIIG